MFLDGKAEAHSPERTAADGAWAVAIIFGAVAVTLLFRVAWDSAGATAVFFRAFAQLHRAASLNVDMPSWRGRGAQFIRVVE